MNKLPLAAALVAGTAMLTSVPLTAQAASPVKAWAEGPLAAGKQVSLYATCSSMRATASGPAGMKATLSPMADRGYLGGQVTVPAGFKAASATFTVTCSDGRTATATLKPAAKAPAKKAGKLTVDGVLGPKTISALQRYVHAKVTGVLDKDTVKAMQVRFGKDAYGAKNKLAVDGVIGKHTVRAVQRAIGSTQTGLAKLDKATVRALQSALNRSKG